MHLRSWCSRRTTNTLMMMMMMMIRCLQSLSRSQHPHRLGLSIRKHFSNPGISGLKFVNSRIPGLIPGLTVVSLFQI